MQLYDLYILIKINIKKFTSKIQHLGGLDGDL